MWSETEFMSFISLPPQCNMLALWSFGHVAFRELGREQFLAFYVSSAVLASLASHLATVRLARGSIGTLWVRYRVPV